MFRVKKRLYLISVAFFVAALFVTFASDTRAGTYLPALVSTTLAVVTLSMLKKPGTPAPEWTMACLLMAVAAAVSLMVFYLTGLSFGFYKVLILSTFFTKYVIPYAVTILTMEVLRSRLLAQKDWKATLLCYLSCVLLDVCLLAPSNMFSSFDHFMDAAGMAIFPALTANLLYHFIAGKYGPLPNILYKLVLVLYPYIIPYDVRMPDIILSFAKIVLPLLILVFIHGLYAKRKFVRARKKVLLSHLSTGILLLLWAGVIMLLSGSFQYKLLVIGSESMTGAINKGDAIIYKEYDILDPLQEGDIIVFSKNQTTTIHRIVDIQRIDGQLRYYTKGDANDDQDPGYITTGQIIGTVTLKIKYIGYPTIWSRSLFQ